MIPLSNKIARKPQPITKKERLKGAALWGVQAQVVPCSSTEVVPRLSLPRIVKTSIPSVRPPSGALCGSTSNEHLLALRW